jgi:hypothetical protein
LITPLFLPYLVDKSNLTTHRESSNDVPPPDDDLKNVVRKKILHYCQVYVDKTDPIIFLTVTVNTSGRVYDDIVRFLFLHVHRETSVLTGDLSRNLNSFTSCELHVW